MKKQWIWIIGVIAFIVFIIVIGYDPNAGKDKPLTFKESAILPHVIIEDKVYDVPAKSQVSYRLGLYDVKKYTKDELQKLIDKYVAEANSVTMKYHSQASHIFIYVYESEQSFKAGYGDNWIAMYEKIDNGTGETSFKGN